MAQETKDKSFKHSFSIAGATIPVEANGSQLIFSPSVTTPDYLSQTQRACQEWLIAIGKGGSAEIKGETVVVNLPNHTFTQDEVTDMEHHFQPLETHRDAPKVAKHEAQAAKHEPAKQETRSSGLGMQQPPPKSMP
jgi:hypothetical protein